MAYGVWRWQYLHECRAGACSHKFPTYLQGGATLFGFIVAYIVSNLRTADVSDDDVRGAAIVGGLQHAA